MFIIKPYRIKKKVLEPWFYDDLWFFDDEVFKIKKEQFLNGSDIILKHINNKFLKEQEFFYLVFSNYKFENHNYTLNLRDNVYYLEDTTVFGNFPLKLLDYFRIQPLIIYLYAFGKEENWTKMNFSYKNLNQMSYHLKS